MTVNRGPGVAPLAGVGTTTLEHRLQLAGLYAENAPGVPRSGVLAQANATLVTARSDMSWDVVPLGSVINRTASEGVYTPTLSGTTNVPTIGAPGADSRWDLIYIKQNDQAKGDPDNAAVTGVVNGTASGSPSKPYSSVPSGGLVLAESRIFAGTTGTSGGSNTTAQVWRHTAARGAPILIRNATELAEITTPALGQRVIRLDAKAQEQYWDGSNFVGSEHAEFTGKYGQPPGSLYGAGPLTKDTALSELDTVLISPANDTINAPSGKWDLHWRGKMTNGATTPAAVPVTATTWMQLTDGAGNEITSFDIATGKASGQINVSGFNFPTGGAFKCRFYTETSGVTLESRIRISRH